MKLTVSELIVALQDIEPRAGGLPVTLNQREIKGIHIAHHPRMGNTGGARVDIRSSDQEGVEVKEW